MLEFLNENLYGLANLSFVSAVFVTILWIHVTMMGITLYFHRDQAHRSVDLHTAVRHFFRFWLWMNTGAPTKEWVAVHRKHHALCEREGDPHSPVIYGLKRVLLEGAELYLDEAKSDATKEKYGKGTVDDWMERNLYARFTNFGIALLVIVNIVLFGAPGIIMAAAELVAMPLLAAGIINGLCHAKGYRNFETNDASTNLWRTGLFLAGEELHNNHHAFPTSARFSMRPKEVDMGWLHLRVLKALGLAKIRRIAAEPQLTDNGGSPDLEALRAVLMHRMHVLRHYMYNVTLPVLDREASSTGGSVTQAVRSCLTWQPHMLDEAARAKLSELSEQLPKFRMVLEYRNELKQLWEGAHTSNDRLLEEFKQWCTRAEASGNEYLTEFAAYLRSFQPQTAVASPT
jgi:stearoyl-CoA desaturase (delta-9 desaturase)